MMTAYDRLSALCLVIQAADSNLQRYYLQNRYETLEKYYNNKSAEMTSKIHVKMASWEGRRFETVISI